MSTLRPRELTELLVVAEKTDFATRDIERVRRSHRGSEARA